MTWQPIRTAPRDGTYILAGYWFDYNSFGRRADWGWCSDVVFLMKTDGLVDGYYDYRVHNAQDAELSGMGYAYSHWMPLPEPPKKRPRRGAW
jgi:Protein of unknown function (DUF551)